MTIDADLATWLLDTDPALRWQVQRDLLHEPEEVWQSTRARVATEGFGARLLALQDADGQWAGGAHFPAGYFDAEPDEKGQPWTATSWSLKALREWGVEASALGDTAQRLAESCRWEYEGLPMWGGEVDVCINSFTLASGAWLGVDMTALAAWFPEHRLADGGWNCEAEEGDSVRSSIHSTLNAVRGLLAYEQLTGDTSVREARHGGEEYFLERRLMYRLSTGEQIDEIITRFMHPSRYVYTVLDALDHFRAASLVDGTLPDPRLAEAIEVVRAARQPDGRWIQGRPLAGLVWFDVDVPEGEPSPWLTLIGTRVLDWWEAA